MSAQAEETDKIFGNIEPDSPPLSPAVLDLARKVFDPYIPYIPDVYTHHPASEEQLNEYTYLLYGYEINPPPLEDWLVLRGLRNAAYTTQKARTIAQRVGAQNIEAGIDGLMDETNEQIEAVNDALIGVRIQRGMRPVALSWKAAELAHLGDKRETGRPTIDHPVEVAAMNHFALEQARCDPAIRPYGNEFRLLNDTVTIISLMHDGPEERQTYLRRLAAGDPRAVINEGQLMFSAYSFRVMLKEMKPSEYPMHFFIGQTLRAFAHRQVAKWMANYIGGIAYGSQLFLFDVTKPGDTTHNSKVEPKPEQSDPAKVRYWHEKLGDYERVPGILQSRIGQTIPPTPIRHLDPAVVGQHYYPALDSITREKTPEEIRATVDSLVDDLRDRVFV